MILMMMSFKAKRSAEPNMKREPLRVEGKKGLPEEEKACGFEGIILAIFNFVSLPMK